MLQHFLVAKVALEKQPCFPSRIGTTSNVPPAQKTTICASCIRGRHLKNNSSCEKQRKKSTLYAGCSSPAEVGAEKNLPDSARMATVFFCKRNLAIKV